MNEGQLLGRIRSVSGKSGFMPHFVMPLDLSHRGTMTEVADVVNVTGIAYLFFARSGFPAHDSAEYLGSAQLDPISSLGTLTAGGGTAWTFLVGADHNLLHRIEQERRGSDVILRLVVTVSSVPREMPNVPKSAMTPTSIKVHQADGPADAYCSIEIPKSKWLELLKAVGYGEYHMAEIPLPRIRKVKALDASLQHVQRAWEHFLNGSDRETLAACHDALEKLTKESVNSNSKPDQNAFTQILSPIGPPEKVQKLAQLLSNCASLLHLGRHEHTPSVELDHRDAELALLLTHACVTYLSKADTLGKRTSSVRQAKV
jgi:hypothetical protein